MGFNVIDMFNDISEVNENSFKIVEIEVDKILVNEDNFYDTKEITELKESIKIFGLQHNLTVKYIDETDTYKLLSGHRRFKAIKELIEEGIININSVPCRIEDVSELEEKLILITSNSTSRVLTSYEKMKQVEEVKKIALEIKNNSNGKIKGKTRDFVSNVLNMSNSEVARYDAISNNLDEEIKEELKEEAISTDTAYTISKMNNDGQEKVKKVIKKAKESNKKVTKKDIEEMKELEKETIKGQVDLSGDTEEVYDEEFALKNNNTVSEIEKIDKALKYFKGNIKDLERLESKNYYEIGIIALEHYRTKLI